MFERSDVLYLQVDSNGRTIAAWRFGTTLALHALICRYVAAGRLVKTKDPPHRKYKAPAFLAKRPADLAALNADFMLVGGKSFL